MKTEGNKFFYLLTLILIVGLTITYSNHFNNGFHFDDSHTIVNNIYIKDIGNIGLFFKDARTISSLPANQQYRPLMTTSLAFDYWMAGKKLEPFYFHLSMFFWYIIQCVMMFFLFRKIFWKISEKSFLFSNNTINYAALFAVSLYAFHTINAETINYIVARSDSYSTLWLIAAVIFYAYFPQWRKFHFYLIPAVIAVLFKQTALVFAPILFCYIFLFEEKSENKFSFSPFFSALKKSLPAFLVCFILYWLQRKMLPATFIPGLTPVYDYVITQPYVILLYFLSFFLPIHLSADTDLMPFRSIFDIRFAIGLLFVFLLVKIIQKTYLKMKYKPIAFGLLWYFFALLPTSSIVPLSEVMNDHRMFFPNVGLVISICWALLLFAKNVYTLNANNFSILAFKKVIFIFCVFIISVFSYCTYQRNKTWSSDEMLWKDVTEKSPNNGRGWMNYGLSLMSKGDYDGAEKCFSKSLEFAPRYSYAHVNMAILKAATGKKKEAEEYFRKGLEYGAENPNSYFFFARFLKNEKRFAEAESLYLKSIELSDAYFSSRHELMEIYYELQNWDKLKSIVESTLRLQPHDEVSLNYLQLSEGKKSKLEIAEETAQKNPTSENFINLSLQYYYAGRFDDCIKSCEEALKIKPNNAIAYNNICSAYNNLKKWDEAIKACEMALKIDTGFTLAKNNLALAKQSRRK